MKRTLEITAAVLVLVLLAMTGAGMAAEKRYSVTVLHNAEVGYYLVDGNGMTLYTLAQDLPNQSACEGDCIYRWPPFYAQFLDLPENLHPSDFEMIMRPDGFQQLTFRGWPLYYFYKDHAPGDRKGQGVKSVWAVANPDCQACYP